MLVDPLSDNADRRRRAPRISVKPARRPTTKTCWSIRDNKRVADIYLGEYMRLYSHYAFREAVRIFLEKNPDAKPEDMKQGFLIDKGDWTTPYFDPKDRSGRRARRLYFAGV